MDCSSLCLSVFVFRFNHEDTKGEDRMLPEYWAFVKQSSEPGSNRLELATARSAATGKLGMRNTEI